MDKGDVAHTYSGVLLSHKAFFFFNFRKELGNREFKNSHH